MKYFYDMIPYDHSYIPGSKLALNITSWCWFRYDGENKKYDYSEVDLDVTDRVLPKILRRHPGLGLWTVNIENWGVYYGKSFETASHAMSNIAKVFRHLRENYPGQYVGIYRMLPAMEFRGVADNRRKGWMLRNDALQMAYGDLLSFYAPSFYQRPMHTTFDIWAKFAEDHVAECRRLDPDKPIHPVLGMRLPPFTRKPYVKEEMFDRMLRWCWDNDCNPIAYDQVASSHKWDGEGSQKALVGTTADVVGISW